MRMNFWPFGFVTGAVRRSAGALAIAALAIPGLHAGQAWASPPTLDPAVVDFGDVAAGSVSPTQLATLRNTTGAPMSIIGIAATGGNFDVAHTCPLAPATLAAGTFCSIQVRFAPAEAGAQSGSLRVAGASVETIAQVALQGNGTSSTVKLAVNPSSGTFPDTILYETSGPLQIVFTNDTGDNIYPEYANAYSLEDTNEFTDYPPYAGVLAPKVNLPLPTGGTPECWRFSYPYYYNDGILGPGESCVIPTYFTPEYLGVRLGMAELYYYDSTESSFTRRVQLVGIGIDAASLGISLSDSVLDLGSIVLGQSGERTLTVTNSGTTRLPLSGISLAGSGAFSATTDCGSSLDPAASCPVTVTCKPEALGTFDGELYVLNGASSSGYEVVRLHCKGVLTPTPKIQVKTTGLVFGEQSLGRTSAAQDVLVSSVGTAPLAISAITAGFPFAAGGDCPPALAPGLSCTARVTFTPIAAGNQTGTLEISSNDPDKPTVKVQLGGTGCRLFSIQNARRGGGLCGP